MVLWQQNNLKLNLLPTHALVADDKTGGKSPAALSKNYRDKRATTSASLPVKFLSSHNRSGKNSLSCLIVWSHNRQIKRRRGTTFFTVNWQSQMNKNQNTLLSRFNCADITENCEKPFSNVLGQNVLNRMHAN